MHESGMLLLTGFRGSSGSSGVSNTSGAESCWSMKGSCHFCSGERTISGSPEYLLMLLLSLPLRPGVIAC